MGYARPNDALKAHCRYTVKCSTPHPQSPGKLINMLFIPEGDLYRLIVNSKLPSAEKFERWVFDEVLPSIRQTGSYQRPIKNEEYQMNELKVFENAEFGKIRTVELNGIPYFVGKDITEILGYQNGSRDINRHVDEEDRGTTEMVSPQGTMQKTTIINESGLYSLILFSKGYTQK